VDEINVFEANFLTLQESLSGLKRVLAVPASFFGMMSSCLVSLEETPEPEPLTSQAIQ